MNCIRAIFWLFGFVAFIAAGVPSFAHAHASHIHHAPGHHVSGHSHQAQPAESDAVDKGKALAGKSFSASISAPGNSPTDSDCNDRGCCSAGHCTSCAAFIASAAGTAWPPANSTAYGRFVASAVASAPADKLRRPPRSLS
jgi:hypothetical protein